MQRVQVLLLSGLFLACLAEDITKQTKSDSKDKSNLKDATTTSKPVMKNEMSQTASNHSASHTDKMQDESKTDKSAEVKKEDMKSSATIGLGFYAGVLPFGYPSYAGYSSYPYYRSYYARPYYGYSYRPVPVLITRPVDRPRPIPVLLG